MVRARRLHRRQPAVNARVAGGGGALPPAHQGGSPAEPPSCAQKSNADAQKDHFSPKAREQPPPGRV